MKRQYLMIFWTNQFWGLVLLLFAFIWISTGLSPLLKVNGLPLIVVRIVAVAGGSLVGIIGLLIFTTLVWSYIDYDNGNIVQECRPLLYKPDSDEKWFVPIKEVTRIQLIIDDNKRHPDYRIVLFGHNKKYPFDEMQRKSKANKVAELIKDAVRTATGKEPVLEETHLD